MNTFVSGSATLLIIASIFVREGGAILCWECNSAHDPRCGEHNFDNHTLGVMDCSQLEREHLKGMEPKYCRKIVQIIGLHTRVIRGCGWIDDEKAHDYCYTRKGTKDVEVTFCQCNRDKCNAGNIFTGSLTAFIMNILLLVKLF